MATSSVFHHGGGRTGVMDPGLGVQGWFTPLRARLHAARIDSRLGAGVPTWESPVYAARARQLTSDRTRRTLADGIDRILDLDEHRRGARFATTAIPTHSPAVQESRPTLLLLSARLRCGSPVNARGVALLRSLLCDGAGPLYAGATPERLANKLRAIDELLDIVD
jgi:hypothetical protein